MPQFADPSDKLNTYGLALKQILKGCSSIAWGDEGTGTDLLLQTSHLLFLLPRGHEWGFMSETERSTGRKSGGGWLGSESDRNGGVPTLLAWASPWPSWHQCSWSTTCLWPFPFLSSADLRMQERRGRRGQAGRGPFMDKEGGPSTGQGVHYIRSKESGNPHMEAPLRNFTEPHHHPKHQSQGH